MRALVEEIHLCGITTFSPHAEIRKTALGGTYYAMEVFWRCIQSVEKRKDGYVIYAAEQAERTTNLYDMRIPAGKDSFGIW